MIYTSYFGNIKRILEENKNVEFFSIAGKSPDFYKNENRFELSILAPRYTWWKEWYVKFKDYPESKELVDFYKEKYSETVLKNLNPHSIVNTLYRISDGKDIILLCYETPEKFCHRKLVSDWFNDNGITCREYKVV